MKSLKSGLLLSLVPVLIVSLAACAAKPTNQADSLPLWENDAAHTASRVVVISDLHLGIDDSFSETTKNKAALVSFLGQLNSSEIDELVIDGDLFDQ